MSRPAIHVIDPNSAVRLPGSTQAAERAVLARCLMAPDTIGQVTSRLLDTDFEDGFIANAVAGLAALQREGRKPGPLSLLSTLDDPDGSVRAYINGVISEAIREPTLPLDDAIEVIRDRAIRRELLALGQSTVPAAMNVGRSPTEIMEEIVDVTDGLMSRARQARRRSFDAKELGEAVFAYLDSDEQIPTTGYEDLDGIIGGYPKGEQTIVAGRTSMGKTAFLVSSMHAAARAGHGVACISLEMPARQLWSRLLTSAAYRYDDPVIYKRIFSRELSESHRKRLVQAHLDCQSLPIRVEEHGDASVAEIGSRCRKIAAEFKRQGRSLDIVFVDYLGLVKPSARYAGNKSQEIADVSNGLRVLAKELNVAMVTLCQLNRAVEGKPDKRPTKADLRDSGEIEEDASNIILLYRPYYYLAQQKPEDPEARQKVAELMEKTRHVLELIIDKNRSGETGVTVELFVDIGANAIRRKSFGAGLKPRSSA